MPSPFPGMDPYLEDLDGWESFHSCFISMLHEWLQARVRPHFLVLQQSAVYLFEAGDDPRGRPPIKPDVFVVAPDPEPVFAGARQRPATPGTAVAERMITEPQTLLVRYPAEVRQRFLQVIDRASRTVVTTIEVLSPTNKDRRGKGFDQFDHKRREVMASPVHWLEIDLLRVGERPVEVTGDLARQSDYYALLKRGVGSPVRPTPAIGETILDGWLWDLRDILPVVAVPLRPSFPDVALDLQVALATVYDRFYEGMIDYTRPPATPLPPADAAWAETCVRAWETRESA